MAFWDVPKKLPFSAAAGGGMFQDKKAGLEWLRRTVPRLRATLRDADQIQIKGEALVLWLQQIKDLACDAEDVIDEFEYEELRNKVEEGGTRGSGGSGSSTLPLPTKDMVHKINESRGRFDEIAKARDDLGIADLRVWDDDLEDTQQRMMQTSSILKEAQVFGRVKEKQEMIEFLLVSDDHEIAPSTIALTGMGGIGKTTLAQLVYNDRRVEEYFNLRMWISMPVNYDVVKITREILRSTGYDDMRSLKGMKNLDVYQWLLAKELKGKRFLLVIDNLWDRIDHRNWECLSAPLFQGEKGSKILITTRDATMAGICQTRKTVNLGGLPFDDCWMLFKAHAFADGNCNKYPRLEAIGKQIVEKFKGVPLAAAAIGGLLYSELEESEWVRIAGSEIWELEDGEDGILSVLKLSYEHLPSHLKQCFAYCSLFQKDHEFDKLELVQQWMAQGFVEGKGRVEDVGTRYFDDLFRRSFFQLVDGKYLMHDLVHQLAVLISQHDHSMAEVDGSHEFLGDSCKVHHLSVLMSNKQLDEMDVERLYRNRSLRTLVFYFPQDSRFQIPCMLFHSLRRLRVLDLGCGGIETLPDSLGSLVHLRYLDVRRNPFEMLPESLCHLYKLQTLKLKGCCNIDKLPKGFSNLINLRHLDVEPKLLSGAIGIGKLTCLQQLELFPISKGRQGMKIEDLKDMNNLRGKLSICNLHWVRRKEVAAQAMLSSKRCLHKLEFEWGEYAQNKNIKLQEKVLEALVPPENLKELAITGYDGVRCPSWMQNLVFSKLESFCLTRCGKWNSLPSLRSLAALKTLAIADCLQLRALPPLPITLRELTIDGSGLEALPEFYQPGELVAGVICDNVSPLLKILRIESCHALKSLQQGLLRHHLRHLTVLSIQRCRELVHWPKGAGFQDTLISLQDELVISNCPKLMAFPAGSTLSTSLKKLALMECPGVVNGPLFAQLQNIPLPSNVYVRKAYSNMAGCYTEALQHLRIVDLLEIDEVDPDGQIDDFNDFRNRPLFISLVCDTARVWSWKCDSWVVAWRVRIRTSDSFTGMSLRILEPFVVQWLPTFVRRIRTMLSISDSFTGMSLRIPEPFEVQWLPAFVQRIRTMLTVSHSFTGMSIPELFVVQRLSAFVQRISSCRTAFGMSLRNPEPFVVQRLPLDEDWWRRLSSAPWRFAHTDEPDHRLILKFFVDHYFHHLPWASSLRWLVLVANHILRAALPSINLASLEGLWISRFGGVRPLLTDALLCHLSGLKELQVFDCPELTLSSLHELTWSLPSLQHLTIERCPNLSSLSLDFHPTPTSPSSSAALQTLFVDDANLLGDAQFVHNQPSSLQGLHIWYSDLTYFTAAMTKGLRYLGQSLRHLSLMSCCKLKHLPSDMLDTLPLLKALSIGYCRELQHLPTSGLPTSVEIILIDGCPLVEGRCKPPSPLPGQGGLRQQQTDWPKIAHIPVIVIGRDIVQGSYREYLELKAKWRGF